MRPLVHYGLLQHMQTDQGCIHGLCPFHEEDTPSFYTTPNRRGYHCFGCHAKGNVIAFVRHKEHLADDWQAARRIQDWFQIVPRDSDAPVTLSKCRRGNETEGASDGEPRKPRPVMDYNPPLTWQLDPLDPGHVYLQQRGLHAATIRYFGLGYYSGPGIMAGRIVIPIHNAAGQLVAYAGRWPGASPPSGEHKYKLPRGFCKSHELYNLHRLSPVTKSVILVEGYWSCLSSAPTGHAQRRGAHGYVALADAMPPAGLAVSTRHGVFDGDAAGRQGTDKAIVSLSSRLWVKAIVCPAGQQPDDLGLEALRCLLHKET